MKVKMLIQITGTRDGVGWPAPGGTVTLPDREAAKLCDAGLATPVRSDKDDVEKRDDKPERKKPGPKPKADTRGSSAKNTSK